MKSVVLILTVVFTILIVTVSSQDDAAQKVPEENAKMDFKCSRTASECAGDNSTCSDTGSCECEDEREGYACQILTEEKENCNMDCGNAGVCYKENGVEKCACPVEKYGTKCQRQRVHHECKHDSIEININPANDDEFKGVIYIRGQEVHDACILEPATKDGWKGYQRNIPLKSCGGAKNETDDSGDYVLSFEVVVQYSPFVITENDQSFVFTCLHRQSGGDVEWNANPIQPNKEYKLPGGTVKEELIPIKLEVLDEDGNPVANDAFQKIGDILTLRFTLEGGKEYSAFRIEKITASNGATGNRLLQKDFVKDGCVQKDVVDNGVVVDFSGDPKKHIDLKIKVFKFLYSNTIEFKAKAKLCKEEGECDIVNCDDVSYEGLGRKKRDLSALLGQDEEEMGTRLYIWYPTGRVNVNHIPVESHERDTPASLEECVQNTAFLILLAGILFFLILLITVIFCLYVRTRPSRYVHDFPANGDNMAPPKSSTHF